MASTIDFDVGDRTRLESYITETMRRNHLYGLSINILKDGRSTYSRGFGSRTVDPPAPATPDTLYGIGSSTKFFTAIAILKLFENGKIDLYDPVEKYIKGLNTDSKNHPVTIHQLLTHSSGYPDLGTAETTIGHMLGQQSVWTPLGTVEDMIRLINEARSERVTTKGDVFMYWNEGYALLGRVIEEVTGKRYSDFITKNILQPLEMKRSTFERSKLEADEDGMTGYYMAKDGKRVPQKFPSHPLVDAAGGLITSVSELGHFVTMLIDGGIYKGTRIIKKGSLEKAFTPHVKNNFAPSMGEGNYYGYGITVDSNFFGHTKLGHGGNVAVSSAYFGFIPNLKIGVCLASNSDFLTSPIGDYALALMLGKDPDTELPWVSFEKKVEILSGKYETYKGATTMQIVQKGFSLFMEVGRDLESLSVPLMFEGNDFYAVEGPDKIKLDVNVHSKDNIDIRFDRLVFHKVGK